MNEPSRPKQFGPYRVIDVVASGGMGVIYCVEHTQTGHQLALKTIRSMRTQSLDGIRREAYALAKLRHPGVVRFSGYGLADGVPWYAMELLRGASLRQHLQARWGACAQGGQTRSALLSTLDVDEPARRAGHGPPGGLSMPVAGGELVETLTIVRRLAQTLAYLHGEGIVHRDLKPDNIVVLDDAVPIIVDFGLMRRVAGAEGREALETDHAAAGTLAFMAPEQILGREPDARADLYALGCILFYALCGRSPFVEHDGESLVVQHLTRTPPAPSSLVDGVPRALDALVAQLLHKDPADRPGHADDVGAALDALGATASPAFREPRPRSYLYRAPFCGQRAVLHAIEDELVAAQRGNGRCVAVAGPSGAGKTRLALEIARHAGMVVVSSEHDAASHASPLQAFRPLLRQVADRCQIQGAAQTHRLLGASCRVLEEYEPALAAVPGRDDYPSATPLPAQEASERAQRCVIELVAAYATVAPVLLVIDDAQWTDDLSLAALRRLAVRPPAPLHASVLVLYRSDTQRPALDELRALDGVLALRLAPLAADDIAHIAGSMVAMPAVPPALLELLVEHSGGSPFFVAEYMRAAVAEGRVVRSDGRWQFQVASADAGFAALHRHGAIDALLARRLDGLGPTARALLEAGAVLGRDWNEAQTAQIAGLGDEAYRATDELLDRQLVLEADGGALRFAHDKLREATLDALAAAERTRLHRRAGEVIEAAGTTADGYRVLAYHYRQAGVRDKAFAFSDRAGQHALGLGAFVEARDHFGAALELGGDMSSFARGQLLRRHGDALLGAGQTDAMVEQMTRAANALAVARMPQTRAGWTATLISQLAVHVAHRVLPPAWIAAPAGQRDALVETANAVDRCGEIFMYQNRSLEYLASRLLAANLGERAVEHRSIALGYANLAIMLILLRQRRLGLHYLERARHHAHATGELDVELRHAQIEAFVLSQHAAWPASLELLARSLARARAAGAHDRAEQLLMTDWIVRWRCGDIAGAMVDGLAVCDSASAGGRALHHAFGHNFVAAPLLHHGELEAAYDRYALGARFFRTLEPSLHLISSLSGMAAARLCLGDLEHAVTLADEACAVLPRFPATHVFGDLLLQFLPQIYVTAWADARAHGRPTARLARRAVETARDARRFARMSPLGVPNALRHEAGIARMHGEHARSHQMLRDSMRGAQRLGMPIVEALSALALGESSAPVAERHRALARAEAIFRARGCLYYLKRINAITDGDPRS